MQRAVRCEFCSRCAQVGDEEPLEQPGGIWNRLERHMIVIPRLDEGGSVNQAEKGDEERTLWEKGRYIKDMRRQELFGEEPKFSLAEVWRTWGKVAGGKGRQARVQDNSHVLR